MKKITHVLVPVIIITTAQTAKAQDSTYVHFDFNSNPWNLPTVGLNGWSTPIYDDDPSAALTKTTTFKWSVGDDSLKMTLTPSDLDETECDNVMVKGEDYDDHDKVKTMLYTFTGSTMTFKAPDGFYMAKVAFDVYRRWSSGGLYSGDATSNQHVWGPDSTKTRSYTSAGTVYTYECWSGDSIEWSLPACTSQTFLHYIDFWLLPLKSNSINEITRDQAKTTAIVTLDGRTIRLNMPEKDAATSLQKGLYIINGRKIVAK